jgi:hypothetical protein
LANVIVRPSDVITDSDETARGRVGCFTHDQTGHFALSARHILDALKGPVRSAGKIAIGAYGHRPLRRQKVTPLFEAIAAVRLGGEAKPEIPDGSYVGPAVIEVRLGMSVRLYGQYPEGRTGQVRALGGLVELSEPFTSSRSFYKHLIEVELDASEGEAFARDEAGALVTDEYNHPLGLLIAGSPSLCYVAPLAEYLDATGMMLLEPQFSNKDVADDVFLHSLHSLVKALRDGKSAFPRPDGDPPVEVASLEPDLELADF